MNLFKLENFPVVKEYLEVSPKNLPRLLPSREIEFEKKLRPGTQPTSKATYKIAPTELQELKK